MENRKTTTYKTSRSNPSKARPIRFALGTTDSPSTIYEMPQNVEQLNTLPTPSFLGSGQVVGTLGEGGVAVIYETWSEKLGVSRAVKLLRPNANMDSIGRFETEMSMTAQLRHPNIISIHNVGEWNGLPFIEMDKVNGLPLSRIIAERGPFPLPVALAVSVMVCRALAYTHSFRYHVGTTEYAGILHRDIKPSNILIDFNGTAYLTDFGVATPMNASLHTMPNTVIGSLQYLAPEQLAGIRLDQRSDLFSIGCTIYEMITGVKTFPETHMGKLSRDRLMHKFNPLESFDIPLTRSVHHLVSRCLRNDREKRFRNANELLIELEKEFRSNADRSPEETVREWLKGPQVIRPPLTHHSRKIPKEFLPFILVVTLSLFGTGAYTLFSLHPKIPSLLEPREMKAGIEVPTDSAGHLIPPPAQDTASDLSPSAESIKDVPYR